MGPLDNRPDNYGPSDPRAVEMALRAVTSELKHLQQDLVLQLAQDITRLLAEKSRLSDDIDKLKMQQQQLRTQQMDAISQQQTTQQQQLAQQMAETLAAQLQQRLVQRIEELSAVPNTSLNSSTNEIRGSVKDRRDRNSTGAFMASMDGTLMTNYEAVQEELGGYQSTLANQLNRLNSLQQQGNAILETLVNRLIEQLQDVSSDVQTTAHLAPEDIQRLLSSANLAKVGSQGSTGVIDRPETPPTPTIRVVPPVPEAPIAQPTPPPAAPAAKKPASMVQVGLILAMTSSVVLSLFNVCLKIILKSQKFPSRNILGLFEVQGFITPGFGNSLLILLLRTIVVLMVMPFLATFLYPQWLQDLNQFVKSGDRDRWFKVVGSGFFLFLSQVMIYIAIGNIPVGIAITIFFIYPIVTVLASWWLFGDRPTIVRYMSMGVIVAGFILAAVPSFSARAMGNVGLGVAAAIGAGITFAGYVLTAQLGQKKLHPIPFTIVGFISIFIFCSVCLLLPWPKQMAVAFDWNLWPNLVVGSALLGVLTLASYLLNNFAIRFAGAALASIIGTSGPALTALFSFLIIQEIILPVQIGGMVLITAGVAAMSVERLLAQKPAPQPTAQATK